ncbi:Bromodomain [Penicillium hispanicum]|uniref:Bromodomain n=1 Tax=Penicillium hispanicum TaxID=1080232 RepID=UPI00253F79FD|nr:Bromodomain [Penicillium hispanicum]KAJ5569416.1 Bromodomain [Penicillium hispanicum]
MLTLLVRSFNPTSLPADRNLRDLALHVPSDAFLPLSTTVALIPQVLLPSSRPGGQWGMPPLSAYTPFESLLFFQSLATSDVRPGSFASLSNLLRNNPLVRDNVAFNADRLSPEALEDLYATLLRDGFNGDPVDLGSSGRPAENPGPSNPKKRKISSPRPEGMSDGVTHGIVIPHLVSHLYARYRELVTKEIREDEKRYAEIKNEIERIKRGDGQATAPTAKPEPSVPMDVEVKRELPQQDRSEQTAVPVEKPVSQVKQSEIEHPAKIMPHPPAPTTGQAQMLVYDTQPTIAQSSHPQNANGQGVPQVPIQPSLPAHAQHVPTTPARSTPVAHPSQVAPRPNMPPTSSVAAGKTGAPALPSATPQPTPAQSSFQQWQLNPSPHSPYSATPQLGSVSAKQSLPTSAQLSQSKPPISSAVTSSPVPISAAQTPAPIGHPRISQTPSVVIPPFSESRASRPRLSIDTPSSSTPWKRTPRLSIPHSPTSPVRPRPEDVSPISERAPSPDAMDVSPPRERKTRRGQAAPTIKTEKSAAATRRNRAISSASSQSRGRSVASREVTPEGAERDLRATGRRKGTTDEQPSKPQHKRKRGVSESVEQEPALPEAPRLDTSRYVVCTRGFHRTAAPIMNDVTTHKLASIFAKPLGERDAPGYHELIYRPQDLKTIKSAVHQGSKAIAAATEAVSTPAGDGDSPAPGTPSKNNVLVLPKSEDLLPPRGIVNSAQLEKELIRMFANAIMFNPVPERGFGPAFPMISDRGSRESTQSGDSDGDEGGIIQDSREMFEDVEQAVTRWRAAERTADELAANKNILSLRRGSASDLNTDSADDVKG